MTRGSAVQSRRKAKILVRISLSSNGEKRRAADQIDPRAAAEHLTESQVVPSSIRGAVRYRADGHRLVDDDVLNRKRSSVIVSGIVMNHHR